MKAVPASPLTLVGVMRPLSCTDVLEEQTFPPLALALAPVTIVMVRHGFIYMDPTPAPPAVYPSIGITLA